MNDHLTIHDKIYILDDAIRYAQEADWPEGLTELQAAKARLLEAEAKRLRRNNQKGRNT